MEQILYTIEGKNYLLVELQVTNNNKAQFERAVQFCNCIFQGIKEYKAGGLFSNAYAIVKVLVPTDQIKVFQSSGI
jgi:hypothetical protein